MSIQGPPPNPEVSTPSTQRLLDVVNWLDRRAQAYRHESERALRENVGVEIHTALWKTAAKTLAADGNTSGAWFAFFPLRTVQSGSGVTLVSRTEASLDLEATNSVFGPGVHESLTGLVEELRRVDPSSLLAWRRVDVSPARLKSDTVARRVSDALRAAAQGIPLGWSGTCVIALLQPPSGFVDWHGMDESWLRGMTVIASRTLGSDEKCKMLVDELVGAYGDVLSKIEKAGEFRRSQGGASDGTARADSRQPANGGPPRTPHSILKDIESEMRLSQQTPVRDKKFDPPRGDTIVFQLSLEKPGPMGLDTFQVWEVFGESDSYDRVRGFLLRFHSAYANGVRTATLVVPPRLPLGWWMGLIEHLRECKSCRSSKALRIRGWDDVPVRRPDPGSV
jgi:hypothetical protein